ncbi:MAG: hypothetical protein V4694_03975 [Pseudomonadota bacterium]
MKKFLIIFIFFFTTLAHADEIKITPKPPTKSRTRVIPDPDTRLSILQLRKKYLLIWLKQKYGDANSRFCGQEKFVGSNQIPANLLCSFYGPTPAEQKKFSDFSFDEIKSVFVREQFVPATTGTPAYEDPRIWELVGITLQFFEKKPANLLSNDEKKLRDFIYSDKIITPIQNSVLCDKIKSTFDLQSALFCTKNERKIIDEEEERKAEEKKHLQEEFLDGKIDALSN